MRCFDVHVVIDRPIGYQDDYGNVYPVNYGFVSGRLAGDGEEQDVYVLTETIEPLTTFNGTVIAIVHRHDDLEDKWVAASAGGVFTPEEIWEKVVFLEQYFDTVIEMLDPE